MSTVIRLARGGRKHLPVYRVSVADKTKATTGKFLQQIGYYDPSQKPKALKIDEASAIAWLEKGAQPSDTVKALFKHQGIYEKWEQVKKGAPLDQVAQIEVQPKEWKSKKQKPSKKVLEKQKAEAEAKAEAEKAKQEEEKAAETKAKTEAAAKAEEKPAEEAKAEEAPAEPKVEAKEAKPEVAKAEEAKPETEPAKEKASADSEKKPEATEEKKADS